MYIFVDESGLFANPGGKPVAVSAIGSICVGGNRLAALRKEFGDLKVSWGAGSAEVKGSGLDEDQVLQVLTVLERHRVRAVLAAVDIALHADAELRAHQADQAALLTANLTEEHQPTLRADLETLQARLARLPVQLYLQLKVLTEVNRTGKAGGSIT